MNNGILSHNETTYSSCNLSPLVLSGAPAIIIGFDGSIKDVSSSAKQILHLRRPGTGETNFFSLVHKSHLYPVMRDVADIICRGKTSAHWLLRLKTSNESWKFFKTEVRKSVTGTEQINLLLNEI